MANPVSSQECSSSFPAPLTPSADAILPPSRRQRALLSAVVTAILAATVALVVLRLALLEKDLCATKACHDFAELLHSALNESAHPCDSFGRFACSRWRHQTEPSVRHLQLNTALETLFDALRSAHVPERRQSVPEQATAFFKSCDDLSQGKGDDLDRVKTLLAEAGVVWPQSATNPDVLGTLLNLDLNLGWPSVLHVGVTTEEDVTRVTILPAPSFSELLDFHLKNEGQRRQYFDVLFQYYVSGPTQLDDHSGGIRPQVAYSLVKELEHAMTGRLQSALERTQPSYPVLLEASELYGGSQMWTERLAKQVKIQNHVLYSTVSKTFLFEFSRLWRKHGDSKMHLYVSWCAVRFAALFANRELLVNHYGLGKYNDGREFAQNCLIQTYRIFGDALFAASSADLFDPRVRHDVRNLVVTVRQSFAHRLSKLAAFAEDSSLTASWATVDRVFSALEYHQRNGGYAPAPRVPDMSNSYVANWVTAYRLRRSGNLSFSGALGKEQLTGRSLYRLDWVSWDFVLSPLALVLPMYHVDLTAAVKYATLGDQAGLATAALTLRRLAARPAGTVELNDSRQCIAEAFGSLPEPRHDVVPELASLSALLDALSQSGDAFRLRGLDGYSTLQTFFIAWCFMRCSADEDDPCSPSLRLVGAFADAFQCSPDTYMNTGKNCAPF